MIRRLSWMVACVVLLAGSSRAGDPAAPVAVPVDLGPDVSAMGENAETPPARPSASTLGWCKGVKSIKASCRDIGEIRAVVKFRKDTWDGRVVTVGVGDQWRYDIPVVGNKATLWTCCPPGHVSVTLVEPKTCLDPVDVVCPD